MSKIVMSKYTVLTNKPLHKNFSGALRGMCFKLPSWFTNWNKNKIIKVYGCSFNYLESENKNPVLSSRYQNQFISVHSNISHEDTIPLKSFYLETGVSENYLSDPNESSLISDFMMVVNNYYTPKIYDLTNSAIDSIIIAFRDAYGELIVIRTSYAPGSDPMELTEIRQAVFKNEIKLAILE
jgi:hypothetical protein